MENEAAFRTAMDTTVNAFDDVMCTIKVAECVTLANFSLNWDGIQPPWAPFDWYMYPEATNVCPGNPCATRILMACAGVHMAAVAREPGATPEDIHKEALYTLAIASTACGAADPLLVIARLHSEAPNNLRGMPGQRSVKRMVLVRALYVVLLAANGARNLWVRLLDTMKSGWVLLVLFVLVLLK